MSSLLTAALRDAVGSDPELQEWCARARQRRLPKVAMVRLPSPLQPARFSQAALAGAPELPAGPSWTGCVGDPWPGWLAAQIHRRVAQILAGVFDPLRARGRVATGLLPASGTRVRVPPELFDATTVSLDLRTSGLVAGSSALFLDVVVEPPAPARQSLSEAAARRYLTTFAAEMASAGCQFTTTDAASLLQGTFSGASMATTRQVTRLLRELGPTAWATRRRPATAMPSPERLAEAQRKAFHEAFGA